MNFLIQFDATLKSSPNISDEYGDRCYGDRSGFGAHYGYDKSGSI